MFQKKIGFAEILGDLWFSFWMAWSRKKRAAKWCPNGTGYVMKGHSYKPECPSSVEESSAVQIPNSKFQIPTSFFQLGNGFTSKNHELFELFRLSWAASGGTPANQRGLTSGASGDAARRVWILWWGGPPPSPPRWHGTFTVRARAREWRSWRGAPPATRLVPQRTLVRTRPIPSLVGRHSETYLPRAFDH